MLIGLSDYEVNSQLDQFMGDSDDDDYIFTELETNDEGTLELKLRSPSGAEPAVYQWPLITGRGDVSPFLIAFISIKTHNYALSYYFSVRKTELWK